MRSFYPCKYITVNINVQVMYAETGLFHRKIFLKRNTEMELLVNETLLQEKMIKYLSAMFLNQKLKILSNRIYFFLLLLNSHIILF